LALRKVVIECGADQATDGRLGLARPESAEHRSQGGGQGAILTTHRRLQARYWGRIIFS